MGGTTSASPIVDNGVVYIGSDDSNFYAFNAGTGANLWSRPFGAPIQVTAAAAGGQIFVPTSDGKIWSIGPNGGSGVGLNLSTGGCSAPAVAYGLIFLSCADNRLYAIKSSWYNTTSTPIAWYINDSGGTGSSPAVADGAVFVGTHGATLALNATTGELLSGLLLLNSSSDAIESSPAVSDGVVYFGADDGYFYAFAMDPGPQAMQLGNKQAPSPKTLRPDLTLKPGKLSTGNDGG
jgi:outer membrane protein assembly factor BamB